MKATTVVPHRRRREQRTDYKQRLRLLKSGKHRAVIRKSNQNVTCQFVAYQPTGDTTTLTTTIKTLRAAGWKGAPGSIPAAYLIGYFAGTEAQKKGVKAAVADLGLAPSTKWSRIYATLKGIIDAGIEVPHSPEILPPDDRVQGKHIADYAAQLKKDAADEYKKRFSHYLKVGLDPEQVPAHVEEIKKKA